MPYDPQLADNVSLLRFRVGDTDDAAQMLPDETYLALIGTYGTRLDKAELAVVQALIAKYAQQANRVTIPTLGTVVEWTDRLAAWRRQETRLAAAIDAYDNSRVGLRTRRVQRFTRERAEYVREREPWQS